MGTTISDIPKTSGTTFSAQFRVTGIKNRKDQYARPYQTMFLVDSTGQLPAFRWKSSTGWQLQELEAVRVKGRIRWFNNGWVVDIFEVSPLWADFEDPENAVQLLPWRQCPKRDALARLRRMVDEIHTWQMRSFINCVFSDMEIALGFISAGASRDHHHHGAGGLLQHSVECAEWILRIAPKPSWRRDLMLVGALLHDVGKTQTCKLIANGTPDTWLIEHDARTLEILAPHLKMLGREWLDGAAGLRYIWTWQHAFRRPQYPVMIEAEIVRSVDRWSALGDVQDLAFSGAADWKRFARFETHSSVQRCWRPRPPPDVSAT